MSNSRFANRRTLYFLAQAGLLVAVGYFWWRYVADNWIQIKNLEVEVPVHTMALALGVTIIGYVLRGVLWAPFRREITGLSMRPHLAFRISAISWLGRYLPGKLWALAGKAWMSAPNKQGVPLEAVAVTVDTLLFQVAGALLAFSLAPAFSFAGSWTTPALAGGAALILVTAIGCHPRLFTPAVNALLRTLRRPPLPRAPRYERLLLFLLANMATYVLWTVALAILMQQISGFELFQFPAVLAVLAFAWVAGFVVLIAPAGLGVRDLLLSAGLSEITRADPATVLALVVGSRLLSIFGEALCAAVALLIPAPTPATKSGAR